MNDGFKCFSQAQSSAGGLQLHGGLRKSGDGVAPASGIESAELSRPAETDDGFRQDTGYDIIRHNRKILYADKTEAQIAECKILLFVITLQEDQLVDAISSFHHGSAPHLSRILSVQIFTAVMLFVSYLIWMRDSSRNSTTMWLEQGDYLVGKERRNASVVVSLVLSLLLILQIMVVLSCAAKVHTSFRDESNKIFRGAPSRAVSILLSGAPSELRNQMRDLEWSFAFRFFEV